MSEIAIPPFVWWILAGGLVLFMVLARVGERESIRAAPLSPGAAPRPSSKSGWLRWRETSAADAAEASTGEGDGAPLSRAELVERLHALAVARATDAIRWYDAGRGWKKRLGVALRLLAILFTAAAGLHPLFDQVFGLAEPLSSPVVPSILVAVAALLVLFDRFGGHTSGWIRFMKAQTSIDQALAGYKAGWLAERGIDAEPDPERTDRLLQRSLRLIRHVDRTVRDETDEWVAEFRQALAENERAVEDARRRQDSGSVEVVVSNYASIPGGRWTLQVGDGAERAVGGARAAEAGIAVGTYQVRGCARFNGLLSQDERAVDVRPGSVAHVELTFISPLAADAQVAAGAPASVNGHGQPSVSSAPSPEPAAPGASAPSAPSPEPADTGAGAGAAAGSQEERSGV